MAATGFRATKALRAARVRAAGYASDFAAKAGIGAATLSRIETGRMRASPRNAARICRALGMTIDQALDAGIFRVEATFDRPRGRETA